MEGNKRIIEDKELFKLLKMKIHEIWKEKWLIQYHSLWSSIINNIVDIKPHNYEELLSISWIWEYKAEIYGEEILRIINEYYPNSESKNWSFLRSTNLRELTNKVKIKKNSYKYRESLYPWYVVVMKQWYFWSIRWEKTELVWDLTWFRIWVDRWTKVTWCPSLEFIRDALISNCVSFVVVENDECIEKWW